MFRILLLVVLGGTLAACGESENTGQAAPVAPPAVNLPVSSIAIASIRKVHPSFEYPAVVEAVQLARVRPEVSAVIKKIHFTPGAMVEKGELLIEFDESNYQTAHKAAAAQLQSAKASLVQAESNWTRAEELMPKGYISQQDYDKARAAIDSSRAAVAAAEADLSRAALDLSHTTIFAPFSGKISKPFYSVGDSVIPHSPNSPQPLFNLVSLDPIFVTAGVQLVQYHKFVLLRKKMEEQGIDVPELEVGLTLAGGGTYPYTGSFEAWDNTSAATSGAIVGRVLFPNPEGLLLPGHNVTLTGQSIRSFNRVLIPQKAVMQDQQGYYVKVVDDSDTVARRDVQLGIRYKDEWIVLDGLEESARVITVGAQMLREGTRVSLQ